MHVDEYRAHDALGLAELVRRRAVTPDELLDTALEQAEAIGGTLNPFVALLEGPARRSIAEGLAHGPFTGVPFALKDLWTQMAGTETSNGSRLFKGAVAEADSEIVRRYRSAGLVIFAKTNTPELGLNASTEPARFGATHNPWRHGMSPGGSSGGAAAAVASGVLPMAHASDGGGSIRIPASCCGLFGLKPSRGRITFGPEKSEGWGGSSTQHVVSRSVRDSAAALDVTCGAMAGDPYAAPPPPGPYLAEAAAEPAPLRVGVSVVSPTGSPVEPSAKSAALKSAERLEELGHVVCEVRWPFSSDELAAARASVVGAHLARTVDARLAQLGRAGEASDLEPLTALLVEQGRGLSATDYVRSVEMMHRLGRSMGQLFEGIDVLVTPTLGRPSFPLGTLDTARPDNFVAAVGPVVGFVGLANLTGQPAMSVPLSRTDDGMPVGSQFIGRYGDEHVLLRLAGQLERAYPWPKLPPMLGG